MTRTPIDYSKTIIYRIVCKDVNVTECYIGQTTNFIKRKSQHKENCNGEKYKNYNCYVYEFIRNNGGFENWDMIEVEKYESVDSNDAKKRERYWIEFYKASLNKNIPTRTFDEWYNENKIQLIEKRKEYCEKNKQQIAEYQKKYVKQHKQQLTKKCKEYYENNKQQILKKNKEYREQNKSQIVEQKQKYREQNKQQISENFKEKIICECGCIIRKYGLLNHKKSQKHLSLIS